MRRDGLNFRVTVVVAGEEADVEVFGPLVNGRLAAGTVGNAMFVCFRVVPDLGTVAVEHVSYTNSDVSIFNSEL